MNPPTICLVSSDEEGAGKSNGIIYREAFHPISKILRNLMFDVDCGKEVYTSLEELTALLNKLTYVWSSQTAEYVWNNVLSALPSIRFIFGNEIDLVDDQKYSLLIVKLLIMYLNFYNEQICNLILDERENEMRCNTVIVKLSIIFKEKRELLLMVLMGCKYQAKYKKFMLPIFRNILTNSDFVQVNNIVSYIRVLLCYKQWRRMCGKNNYDYFNDCVDKFLPACVPSIESDQNVLKWILPVPKNKRSKATRFLLGSRLLSENGAVKKFFELSLTQAEQSTEIDSIRKNIELLKIRAVFNPHAKTETKSTTINTTANKISPSESSEVLILSDDDTFNSYDDSRISLVNSKTIDTVNPPRILSNKVVFRASNAKSNALVKKSIKNRNLKNNNVLIIEDSGDDRKDVEKFNAQVKLISRKTKMKRRKSTYAIKDNVILLPETDSEEEKIVQKTVRKVKRRKPKASVSSVPKATLIDYMPNNSESNTSETEPIPSLTSITESPVIDENPLTNTNKLPNSVNDPSSDSPHSHSELIQSSYDNEVFKAVRTSRCIKKTKALCTIFGEVSSTTITDVQNSENDLPVQATQTCQASLDVDSSSGVISSMAEAREVGCGVLQFVADTQCSEEPHGSNLLKASTPSSEPIDTQIDDINKCSDKNTATKTPEITYSNSFAKETKEKDLPCNKTSENPELINNNNEPNELSPNIANQISCESHKKASDSMHELSNQNTNEHLNKYDQISNLSEVSSNPSGEKMLDDELEDISEDENILDSAHDDILADITSRSSTPRESPPTPLMDENPSYADHLDSLSDSSMEKAFFPVNLESLKIPFHENELEKPQELDRSSQYDTSTTCALPNTAGKHEHDDLDQEKLSTLAKSKITVENFAKKDQFNLQYISPDDFEDNNSSVSISLSISTINEATVDDQGTSKLLEQIDQATMSDFTQSKSKSKWDELSLNAYFDEISQSSSILDETCNTVIDTNVEISINHPEKSDTIDETLAGVCYPLAESTNVPIDDDKQNQVKRAEQIFQSSQISEQLPKLVERAVAVSCSSTETKVLIDHDKSIQIKSSSVEILETKEETVKVNILNAQIVDSRGDAESVAVKENVDIIQTPAIEESEISHTTKENEKCLSITAPENNLFQMNNNTNPSIDCIATQTTNEISPLDIQLKQTKELSGEFEFQNKKAADIDISTCREEVTNSGMPLFRDERPVVQTRQTQSPDRTKHGKFDKLSEIARPRVTEFDEKTKHNCDNTKQSDYDLENATKVENSLVKIAKKPEKSVKNIVSDAIEKKQKRTTKGVKSPTARSRLKASKLFTVVQEEDDDENLPLAELCFRKKQILNKSNRTNERKPKRKSVVGRRNVKNTKPKACSSNISRELYPDDNAVADISSQLSKIPECYQKCKFPNYGHNEMLRDSFMRMLYLKRAPLNGLNEMAVVPDFTIPLVNDQPKSIVNGDLISKSSERFAEKLDAPYCACKSIQLNSEVSITPILNSPVSVKAVSACSPVLVENKSTDSTFLDNLDLLASTAIDGNKNYENNTNTNSKSTNSLKNSHNLQSSLTTKTVGNKDRKPQIKPMQEKHVAAINSIWQQDNTKEILRSITSVQDTLTDVAQVNNTKKKATRSPKVSNNFKLLDENKANSSKTDRKPKATIDLNPELNVNKSVDKPSARVQNNIVPTKRSLNATVRVLKKRAEQLYQSTDNSSFANRQNSVKSSCGKSKRKLIANDCDNVLKSIPNEFKECTILLQNISIKVEKETSDRTSPLDLHLSKSISQKIEDINSMKISIKLENTEECTVNSSDALNLSTLSNKISIETPSELVPPQFELVAPVNKSSTDNLLKRPSIADDYSRNSENSIPNSIKCSLEKVLLPQTNPKDSKCIDDNRLIVAECAKHHVTYSGDKAKAKDDKFDDVMPKVVNPTNTCNRTELIKISLPIEILKKMRLQNASNIKAQIEKMFQNNKEELLSSNDHAKAINVPKIEVHSEDAPALQATCVAETVLDKTIAPDTSIINRVCESIVKENSVTEARKVRSNETSCMILSVKVKKQMGFEFGISVDKTAKQDIVEKPSLSVLQNQSTDDNGDKSTAPAKSDVRTKQLSTFEHVPTVSVKKELIQAVMPQHTAMVPSSELINIQQTTNDVQKRAEASVQLSETTADLHNMEENSVNLSTASTDLQKIVQIDKDFEILKSSIAEVSGSELYSVTREETIIPEPNNLGNVVESMAIDEEKPISLAADIPNCQGANNNSLLPLLATQSLDLSHNVIESTQISDSQANMNISNASSYADADISMQHEVEYKTCSSDKIGSKKEVKCKKMVKTKKRQKFKDSALNQRDKKESDSDDGTECNNKTHCLKSFAVEKSNDWKLELEILHKYQSILGKPFSDEQTELISMLGRKAKILNNETLRLFNCVKMNMIKNYIASIASNTKVDQRSLHAVIAVLRGIEHKTHVTSKMLEELEFKLRYWKREDEFIRKNCRFTKLFHFIKKWENVKRNLFSSSKQKFKKMKPLPKSIKTVRFAVAFDSNLQLSDSKSETTTNHTNSYSIPLSLKHLAERIVAKLPSKDIQPLPEREIKMHIPEGTHTSPSKKAFMDSHSETNASQLGEDFNNKNKPIKPEIIENVVTHLIELVTSSTEKISHPKNSPITTDDEKPDLLNLESVKLSEIPQIYSLSKAEYSESKNVDLTENVSTVSTTVKFETTEHNIITSDTLPPSNTPFDSDIHIVDDVCVKTTQNLTDSPETRQDTLSETELSQNKSENIPMCKEDMHEVGSPAKAAYPFESTKVDETPSSDIQKSPELASLITNTMSQIIEISTPTATLDKLPEKTTTRSITTADFLNDINKTITAVHKKTDETSAITVSDNLTEEHGNTNSTVENNSFSTSSYNMLTHGGSSENLELPILNESLFDDMSESFMVSGFTDLESKNDSSKFLEPIMRREHSKRDSLISGYAQPEKLPDAEILSPLSLSDWCYDMICNNDNGKCIVGDYSILPTNSESVNMNEILKNPHTSQFTVGSDFQIDFLSDFSMQSLEMDKNDLNDHTNENEAFVQDAQSPIDVEVENTELSHLKDNSGMDEIHNLNCGTTSELANAREMDDIIEYAPHITANDINVSTEIIRNDIGPPIVESFSFVDSDSSCSAYKPNNTSPQMIEIIDDQSSNSCSLVKIKENLTHTAENNFENLYTSLKQNHFSKIQTELGLNTSKYRTQLDDNECSTINKEDLRAISSTDFDLLPPSPKKMKLTPAPVISVNAIVPVSHVTPVAPPSSLNPVPPVTPPIGNVMSTKITSPSTPRKERKSSVNDTLPIFAGSPRNRTPFTISIRHRNRHTPASEPNVISKTTKINPLQSPREIETGGKKSLAESHSKNPHQKSCTPNIQTTSMIKNEKKIENKKNQKQFHDMPDLECDPEDNDNIVKNNCSFSKAIDSCKANDTSVQLNSELNSSINLETTSSINKVVRIFLNDVNDVEEVEVTTEPSAIIERSIDLLVRQTSSDEQIQRTDPLGISSTQAPKFENRKNILAPTVAPLVKQSQHAPIDHNELFEQLKKSSPVTFPLQQYRKRSPVTVSKESGLSSSDTKLVGQPYALSANMLRNTLKKPPKIDLFLNENQTKQKSSNSSFQIKPPQERDISNQKVCPTQNKLHSSPIIGHKSSTITTADYSSTEKCTANVNANACNKNINNRLKVVHTTSNLTHKRLGYHQNLNEHPSVNISDHSQATVRISSLSSSTTCSSSFSTQTASSSSLSARPHQTTSVKPVFITNAFDRARLLKSSAPQTSKPIPKTMGHNHKRDVDHKGLVRLPALKYLNTKSSSPNLSPLTNVHIPKRKNCGPSSTDANGAWTPIDLSNKELLEYYLNQKKTKSEHEYAFK